MTKYKELEFKAILVTRGNRIVYHYDKVATFTLSNVIADTEEELLEIIQEHSEWVNDRHVNCGLSDKIIKEVFTRIVNVEGNKRFVTYSDTEPKDDQYRCFGYHIVPYLVNVRNQEVYKEPEPYTDIFRPSNDIVKTYTFNIDQMYTKIKIAKSRWLEFAENYFPGNPKWEEFRKSEGFIKSTYSQQS